MVSLLSSEQKALTMVKALVCLKVMMIVTRKTKSGSNLNIQMVNPFLLVGLQAAELHGDLSQVQCLNTLECFRK